MSDISETDLEALRRIDTPSICNALELAGPERRAAGFTTRPLVCAVPSLPPVAGFARTATIRAAAAPTLSPAELREARMAYFGYVAAAPGPTVVVIQDLDPEPGFGAFWGEVNSAIHKGLGCLGVVTNGSIRDLDALAPGFQMLAGSVGPSHAHCHVVDFGGPVEVSGMTVRHGEIVHADRHGAVVIPPALAAALPAADELLARREAVILEACRRPDFDVAALGTALAASVEVR